MNFSAAMIFAVLLDAAFKSVVVLLAALVATWLMRNVAASARHLVWTAAVAISLLLPVGSALLPAYRIALLPAESARAVEVHTPERVSVSTSISMPAPTIETYPAAHEPAITDNRSAALATSDQAPHPLLGTLPARPVVTEKKPFHIQITASFVIDAIWLSGSAMLASIWLIGLFAAWRLARAASLITEGSLFDTAMSIRREMNIRAPVQLRLGSSVTMPVAGGVLRPFVLLPATAAQWPTDQLRSVLLHELAHVKRFDCFTQAIAHLARSLYWFNPLLWLAARQLRIERERACDDVVLAYGPSATTYADHLMAIARSMGHGSISNMGVVAIARPSGLRRRVMNILDSRIDRRILSTRIMLVAGVVAIAVFLPLSSIRLSRKSAVAAGQVAGPTTQPQNAADETAAPLPPLPAKIPSKLIAVRALLPNGSPIKIDSIKEIIVWIEQGPSKDGLEPKVLGRFADGWLLVDTQISALSKPGARTEITFLWSGHTIHAETTLPLNSRQISYQSLADPNEINIDESTGPVAGPDEIAGRVLDPAGKPVAGASFESDAPDIVKKKFPKRFIAETTDADGVFRFSQVAERGEQHFYELWTKGYAARWLGDLPVGRGFTVHLYDNTRLRGKLVLPDGQAAAGATLEFTTTKQTIKQNNDFAFPFTASTVADATGSYDIPVEPGIYEVQITSPSGASARLENVAVASGAVVALPSQLDPGASLTLQALDSVTGKPVVGAHFAVEARANGWILDQPGTDRVSDAHGLVHWDNLVPGATQFRVRADGYARWYFDSYKPKPARLSIDQLFSDVPVGSTAWKVLMEPAVRIVGQVLAPDGTPAAGAIVDIAGLRTGDTRYARSADAQGKFLLQFADLRDFDWNDGPISAKERLYAIVACDPKRRWANGLSPAFWPSAGTTRTLTIQMTTGGRMHGRVVDPAGKPVARIEVEAVNTDDSDRDYYNPRTLTDVDGRYELPPMRAGDYKLYPDICFGVNITIPPGYVPSVIHIAESQTLAVPDLIYNGPPPSPVPGGHEDQYRAIPSFPATAPATQASSAPATQQASAAATAAASASSPPTNSSPRQADTAHILDLTVLDQSSGQPIRGAHIQFYREPDQGATTTDDQGKATITLGASPAAWVVVQKDHDVGKMIKWTDTGKNETIPAAYTVKLEPGTTIGGKVVDDAGKPIAGAHAVVLVRDKLPDPHELMWVRFENVITDAGGNWQFDDIPAGSTNIAMGAWDYQCLDQASFPMMAYSPISALRDKTATLKLKRGVPMRGTVFGPNGEPLEHATIAFGADRVASNIIPPFETDASGGFALAARPNSVAVLTATAPGCAPEIQDVELGTEPVKIDFHLKAGNVLTGSVVDEAGKPIPNGYIMLDTWRRIRPNPQTVRTDAQGEFVWREAPPDAVEANVQAEGYVTRTGIEMTAGQPARVTLQEPTRVDGTVVDSQTGKPIPSFRLILGTYFGEGTKIAWGRQAQQIRKETDGKFSFHLTWSYPGYVVRIEADGYAPAESRVFKESEKHVELSFKLTKDVTLSARVVTADGKPAAGATAVLVEAGQSTHIVNGESQQKQQQPNESECPQATVAGDGVVNLPAPAGGFNVAIFGEPGYATVTAEQWRSGQPIVLQAWAAIEGTLHIGNKPGAAQTVVVDMAGELAEDRFRVSEPLISHQIETQTDAAGHFLIPRVPAGKASISRQVMIPHGDFEASERTETQFITSISGQTLKVSLGGTGRAVTGRAAISPEITMHRDRFYIFASVISVEKPPEAPIPAEVKSGSDEQQIKWWEDFRATDAGRAYDEGVRTFYADGRRYPVQLAQDGTFRIDDVRAGTYDLKFDIMRHGGAYQPGQFIGQSKTRFTVPEMPGGRSDEPLELPPITVATSVVASSQPATSSAKP